jgi:tryptophan-rich sensory protein
MSGMNSPIPSVIRFLALAGFIVITFCAPLAGIVSPPGDWYASLAKPSWNPPSWIFGPVWTALYLMMAVAAWLVWKRDGWRKAIWFYLAQLALNAAWTPVFFGMHEIGWALMEIIALLLAILITLRAFLHVSKPAAFLLLPYLAWVSFATFLNYTLWRMNPG